MGNEVGADPPYVSPRYSRTSFHQDRLAARDPPRISFRIWAAKKSGSFRSTPQIAPKNAYRLRRGKVDYGDPARRSRPPYARRQLRGPSAGRPSNNSSSISPASSAVMSPTTENMGARPHDRVLEGLKHVLPRSAHHAVERYHSGPSHRDDHRRPWSRTYPRRYRPDPWRGSECWPRPVHGGTRSSASSIESAGSRPGDWMQKVHRLHRVSRRRSNPRGDGQRVVADVVSEIGGGSLPEPAGTPVRPSRRSLTLESEPRIRLTAPRFPWWSRLAASPRRGSRWR